MRVLDVFSWLPAQVVSTEQLEQIFVKHKNGLCDDTYNISSQIPCNATECVLNCRNELVEEGKEVACVLKGEVIIALIGYKE